MKKNNDLPERELTLQRIEAAKRKLGKDLLILAHFYQGDDIIRFADFVGDSLQLAEKASLHKEARYIVFCSVSFMAETARMLCAPGQEVLHPEPNARCPLADMAAIEGVEEVWKDLQTLNRKIIPVVYVNSNADLKAFCARHGGTVCTSSNVKKIFNHVLSQGASIFFFPDENMGRNVSHDLGLKDDEIFLWDPEKGLTGAGNTSPEKAKVFLWEGFCIVHRIMGRREIESLRSRYEGIKIIVHPECTPEVYNLADYAGSTSYIKNMVDTSAPGSTWAIGTEWNFVNRIKTGNPDKLVIPLKEERCKEMAKVTPKKLLYVLEGLVEGELRNKVTVGEGIAGEARIALKRMMEIV
ncbi:MAG: quinolinate synthase [Syntrophus sp. (in: bacteria)]|nr:quinolinate synthase [Syntrophus sp. (in: bacteria)]